MLTLLVREEHYAL
jgi:hypothetical protein